MTKTKKFPTITFLFIFLGMFFVFANNVYAIEYKAQIGFGKFSVPVEIGPNSIGEYITEIYKYAVGIVGILASIVIMWGGFRWLTAGGDKNAVGDAKKWIEGALSGLVLVMTSYLILYFVNPDLIAFKSINIEPINKSQTYSTPKPTPQESAVAILDSSPSCCVVNYTTNGLFGSDHRLCFDNIKKHECNNTFAGGTSAAGQGNISTIATQDDGGSCDFYRQPTISPRCN